MEIAHNSKFAQPASRPLRLLFRFGIGVTIYTSFLTYLCSDGGMGIVHFFMATSGRAVQWITPGSGGAIIGINFLLGVALLVVPLSGVKLIARSGVKNDPVLKGLAALISPDPAPNLPYRLLLVIGLVVLPLKSVALIATQFIHGFNIFNSWDTPVTLGLYLREYAGHAPLEIMGFGMVAMASIWICGEGFRKLLTMSSTAPDQCLGLVLALSIWKHKTSTFLAIAGLITILLSGILEISSFAAVS